MSDLQVPVSRDRLCVTPHEDEGYLSPSEEDLKRFKTNRSAGFLNCKPPNSLRLDSGVRHDNNNEQDEDQIAWEEVAFLPHVEEQHLSWDRLKLPVPHRFRNEQRSCLRQIRKTPESLYITDNSEHHVNLTKKVWKSLEAVPRLKPGITAGSDFHRQDEARQKVQSVIEDPVHLPPKQFVQHIFHMLCGRVSISFSRMPGDKYRFTRNPKVLVRGMSPGLVANLSEEFLVSGRIFKRLTHVSALHYDEKLMVREGFGCNAVITSFLKFTSDYLKFYQTALMLKVSNITTFGALAIFFKPFRHQLSTLEKILNLYLATDQITLLKGLNSMMLCSETPYVADLLRSAFITCAAAYLRYVADWTFRGALTKGFHIQRTKAFNYQDRRYWVKQFSQVTAVPKFLESAVNIIFETGKAINLLNLIRNTEPRTCLLSCILQDEGTVIRPAVEFSQVTLLEKDWQIKLESFFEEYSFLQDDIAAALNCSIGDDPQSIIDFDAIEDAKKSFELKHKESRQKLNDEKLEKQRTLFNILNQQLAEKRDREKQELENEQQENEKIASYIQAVDQRDLNEEIRLMKKHFGERIPDTVGLRNIKQRIAATKTEGKFVNQNSADNIDANSHSNENHPDEIEEEEKDDETLEDDINTGKILCDDCVTESITETHEQLPIHQPKNDNVALKEALVANVNTSQLDKKQIHRNWSSDHFENKFDPSNLIVRNALPYKTSLEFESSGFVKLPQPLLMAKTQSSTSNENDESALRHDSFFLNYFFQQSAIIPVKAQNRMVNSALLHYFIVEKKLFQHIEALNSYLCLQNGLFGHFLNDLLIKEVKTGALLKKEDIPLKATRLNEILGEALSLSSEGSGDKSEIRDNLGFILVRETSRNSVDFDAQKPSKSRILTSDYELLDEITVSYSVEWPLSILLTDDLLIHYEQLFIHLMRLYRAELLLLEKFSVLKSKGNSSRQLGILHYYRYRMLHFVRTVRHYINVTVIHSAWTELVSSFPKMNSLDKLYEGLVRHIKSVMSNCLLGAKSEAVRKLLVDQLIVIECFCTEVDSCSSGVNWDAGEEIPTRRFNKLIQKFKVWEEIQKVFLTVFFKLSDKGVYPKVSCFLQLFNFNDFFGKKAASD